MEFSEAYVSYFQPSCSSTVSHKHDIWWIVLNHGKRHFELHHNGFLTTQFSRIMKVALNVLITKQSSRITRRSLCGGALRDPTSILEVMVINRFIVIKLAIFRMNDLENPKCRLNYRNSIQLRNYCEN